MVNLITNKVVVTNVVNKATNEENFMFQSKKEGYASVCLSIVKPYSVVNEQTGSTFTQYRKRVAWVGGLEEDLKKMFTHDGQIVEGNIVRLFKFEPFYDGQQPVINPQTNQPILKDGKVFYFKDVYDQSGMLKDKWVESSSDTLNGSTQLTNSQTIPVEEFEVM